MYLIGEALVGKEPEIAHVDIVIGTKDGPVGQAFANNLGNYSAGHTPLLAVVRPNLATKPYTLVIPKVTVQDISDAAKIFGPAQAGIGKAVVDAVEEGLAEPPTRDEHSPAGAAVVDGRLWPAEGDPTHRSLPA